MIPGPRRSLVHKRDLVLTLVARQLKVRYRRSTIGFLWSMLQPLLMMAVLYVVFSSVFRFDVDNYPVYVLTGLLFWNFFSQSVTMAMQSLGANASLLQKLPAPKLVFPLSHVLAGVVNLVLSSVSLFAIFLLTRHDMTPALLVLPLSLAIATVFILGIGLLLAPLAVLFSTDTTELVSVLLTMFYFLTPVFYPVSIVPEQFAPLVEYNPIWVILEIVRVPIYEGVLPAFGAVLTGCGLALASIAIGGFTFRRASRYVPLYL